MPAGIFRKIWEAAGRPEPCAPPQVIYDPDPNPKNEEQAIARSHRIGQTRQVTATPSPPPRPPAAPRATCSAAPAGGRLPASLLSRFRLLLPARPHLLWPLIHLASPPMCGFPRSICRASTCSG